MIYLDHAASVKPYPEVLDCFLEVSSRHFANPSSLHRLGFEAEKIIKDARLKLATDLGCSPFNLYFTSGVTESINTAIKSYLNEHPNSGKEILTVSTEHHATLEACLSMEKQGYRVLSLPVTPNGTVDLEALKNALSDDTSLLTFSHVNNETGAITDIKAIVKLRDQYAPKAKIHVDCAQSWGKIRINLEESGIDLASFSGHKMGALKGIGLLYVKKNLRLQPLIHGGGQQQGLRGGTENPAMVASLAVAAEINKKRLNSYTKQVKDLKEYLLEKLTNSGLTYVLHSGEDGLPNIVNLSFLGVKSETLLHALADQEIYIATRSACSGKDAYSHVLKAMGVSEEELDSSIRISFDLDNTKEEIDTLVDSLMNLVPVLSQVRRK